MVADDAWIRANKIGGRYLRLWGIIIAVVGVVCLVVPPLNMSWIWFFGLAPAFSGIGILQACRAINRA